MAGKLSPITLVKKTVSEWSTDQAATLGAALAFYSMLSIGPLLLIAVSVVGLVLGHDEAGRMIIGQMRNLVGNEGAIAMQMVVEHAQNTDKGIIATAIGIVTLLISAAGFFGQLQSALNIIFDCPKTKFNMWEFVKKRLLSFGMVIGICLLLLSSLVISAVLSAITGMFGDGASFVLQAANVIISLVVSTLLFATAFRVMPDVKIPWRDLWIGALITAVLFAIGKSLIGLYLGRSSFASTYGAAGSLIVLLVWIYYSVQIIFFGAEFTQVMAQSRGKTFPLKKGFEPKTPDATPDKLPEPAYAVPERPVPGLVSTVISLIAIAGITVALRRPKNLRYR